MHISATLASSLLLASSPALAAYNLLKDYSGQNFFQGWTFKDGFDDTTNGAVNYLNQSAAAANKLAFIDGSGHAIVKVDNTTNLPNVTVVTDQQKRNSVFITTDDFFSVGTLFVFDAVHIPFGCSVWPAFWTRAVTWPQGGEIDILESVNRKTNNQMTLHTLAGCTQPADVQQLGSTVGADCSAGTNSTIGCTVADNDKTSYGDGFNNAGGGVWATQFDETGVFVWFWNRANIPPSVSSATDSIDPSTFGTPTAAWPSSSCNIAESFQPQQLVLDITLCGDFAGEPSVYTATCAQPGVTADANTCYVENVNGTGANYADAYFDINYVKVFALPNATTTSTGTSSPSSTGGSAPTSGGNNTSQDGSGNGNDAPGLRSYGYTTALLSALALPAALLAML